MSDNSKAKWPNGMEVYIQDTSATARIVSKGKLPSRIDDNPLMEIFSKTVDEAESRARQICALPRMVELLKRLADKDINLNDAELEARRICKSINELPGEGSEG